MRDTGEKIPGTELLSDIDSSILVTAQARNLLIPKEETTPLGYVKAEQTGGVEAAVYFYYDHDSYACGGRVFTNSSFKTGWAKVIREDLEAKFELISIGDKTAVLTPQSKDTVNLIDFHEASDDQPEFISVFSQRLTSDNELTELRYGEQEIDAAVKDVGRVVATVANSLHGFCPNAQPVCMDISLPGSLLEGQAARETMLNMKALPAPRELVASELSPLPGQEKFPTFEEFGGLEAEIAQLKDFAGDVWQPSELWEEYQLQRPGAVLLQGPGGVGKTALVKALAREMRARYQEVSVSDIISMWVGEPARKLRGQFDEAAKIDGPVILFFDEFDGLFSKGAGGNMGAAQSLVAEFKVILDRKERYPNVLVALAANNLDSFDPALLRPGRIDLVLPIKHPDRAARAAIFGKYLVAREQHFQLPTTSVPEGMDIDQDLDKVEPKSLGSIDFDRLGELSDDWTGADIKQVIDDAMRAKMRQHRDRGSPPPSITQRQLEAAITWHKQHRPSEAGN